MNKIVFRVAMGLTLLSFFAVGQSAGQKERPLSPSEKMDELFGFWDRLDQPGFAVVVVKDGQVAYQKVFGLACQEHAAAITPNTDFNTATLAQVFVGQSVAMLEKQGKLSLEDDVRKYIPEIRDFGTQVKLRHLVYQSSGLRDWLPVLQLTGRDKLEVTIDTVLKVVKAQKQLIFPPGDRFLFSATNYDLLAEVIKRATGKSFSEWAWENIFKPLKMTRTQFRDNYRSIFDNEALSYNFTRQEYLRGVDTLSLTGSHSLFTSVADLAKWLVNLESGPADGRDIFAKMFMAGALNSGGASISGYGLNVGSWRGKRVVGQVGAWAGSGAALSYFPDQKFGFAVLANWDYTSIDGFSADIIDIYLPAPTPAPAPAPPVKKSPPAAAKKAVKVGPEKLDRYVGDYRMGPGQIYSISRAGDQLVFNVPGAKFPLISLSETEFLLAVADARITFQTDREGKVQHFVWKQGGDEQIAPKIVLVKPTPRELQEFTGAYSNEELALRYAVELRGDALIVTTPGQNDIRLAPDEKDRFTTSSRIFPMVIFQRDGQNQVTGFIIDSDPVRDLVFKRTF
jgi:CubicO group peptidase (beta-lactamase class C family)